MRWDCGVGSCHFYPVNHNLDCASTVVHFVILNLELRAFNQAIGIVKWNACIKISLCTKNFFFITRHRKGAYWVICLVLFTIVFIFICVLGLQVGIITLKKITCSYNLFRFTMNKSDIADNLVPSYNSIQKHHAHLLCKLWIYKIKECELNHHL